MIPVRSRLRGFTLIELLVVIAIIAVLASILFPVFARAKDNARSSGCLSNSRQIGLALMMYAADNKDGFPFARMMMEGPMKSMATWLDSVEKYGSSGLLHRCPSDSSALWDAPDPAMRRRTTYGINGYFTPNHPPYWGLKSSNIPNPSTCVVATELAPTLNKDHFMPMFWGNPPRVQNSMVQNGQWDPAKAEPKTLAIRVHQGRANYVFADGHAARHEFTDSWRQSDGSAPTVDWYDPLRQ